MSKKQWQDKIACIKKQQGAEEDRSSRNAEARAEAAEQGRPHDA